MPSSGGAIRGVGGGVMDQIKVGDIVVSRLRGPFEAYIIGRIYEDASGDRRFWYLENAESREIAIRKGQSRRSGEHRVWLFADPDDNACTEIPKPSH